MHDLDPDDGQQHNRRQPASRLDRPENRIDARQRSAGRAPRSPLPDEAMADLSIMDLDELEIEAKREPLRDQRQARITSAIRADRRHAREKVEERHRIGLFRLLVGAAIFSMVVVACGLLQSQADVVEAGLLALCVICGGSLYQLGFRG